MQLDISFRKVFCIIFLTFSSLVLMPYTAGNTPKTSDVSLEINSNLELIEYSLKTGFNENVTSINIELPSDTWNINDIELNFDEIEFETEVKIIEESPSNFVVIDKFNHGYGVQIKINDPTIIYGINIYANNESSGNIPIYFQIKGYNFATNSPNSTVYGSIALKMPYSEIPSWYLLNFTTPIHLTQGDYYLVIDGSSIGNSPKSKYYWYFNDINPLNPNLYASKYDSGSWLEGYQGAPFLHKLIQKVNSSFFPEEINLTAQIDGDLYEIEDGPHRGKGFLKKNNINYKPNKNELNIKVKNNKTSSLRFHLNYSLRISNNFLAPGILNIRSNSSNEWSVRPDIQRFSSNDTIKFKIPRSWSNLNVFKNGE
ncbi:MAG: hypothetical protein ACXABG_11885, partial [Promethearchaeota archaeon]